MQQHFYLSLNWLLTFLNIAAQIDYVYRYNTTRSNALYRNSASLCGYYNSPLREVLYFRVKETVVNGVEGDVEIERGARARTRMFTCPYKLTKHSEDECRLSNQCEQ